MIFREFPKRLSIIPYDEEGDEGDRLEITVMFVTKKFRSLPGGDEAELLVAVGYDSDNNIHEAILNLSKIIEVEDYGSKIRSSRDSGREASNRRKKTRVRNNNSSDTEAIETEE